MAAVCNIDSNFNQGEIMKIPVYQVDAFTDNPFQGNPAAVVILDQPQTIRWMQLVAREMNLSETAFVCREARGYHLQWFTPEAEVELCGHATLSAAHVLWESGRESLENPIFFSTLSGLLGARRRQDGVIELDFPAAGCVSGNLPEEVITAVGAAPRSVCISGDKWLLEYPSEDAILNLRPDFLELKKISGRGLIVTSSSKKPEFDFVSRYFAPWIGVNEDPVTGSAHCILGPYWGQKLGKTSLKARQVSSRGGELQVELNGERVLIGGKAVTVLQGELNC